MESKAQDIAGLTVGLSKLGLSGITGGAITYAFTAVRPYVINGKVYSITGGTTFPVVDANTGVNFVGLTKANTGTVFVLGGSSATTTDVVAVQGSVETLDAHGNFYFAPKFPQLPSDFCPLAYIIAKAGSTFVAASFQPGTDNWNTTGMTYATQDIVALPDRAQVA